MQEFKIIVTEGNKEAFIKSIGELIDQKLEQLKPKSIQTAQVKYLTRKEAAQFLRCSLPTLDKYRRSGTLTAHKIGAKVLFNQEELKRVLLSKEELSA